MNYKVLETDNEARRIVRFDNGKEYKIRRLSLALITKIGLNPDLTNSQAFKDLLSQAHKKDDKVTIPVEQFLSSIPSLYAVDDKVVYYGVVEPKLELEEMDGIQVVNDVVTEEKKALADEIRKLSGMGKEGVETLLPFSVTGNSSKSSMPSDTDTDKVQQK